MVKAIFLFSLWVAFSFAQNNTNTIDLSNYNHSMSIKLSHNKGGQLLTRIAQLHAQDIGLGLKGEIGMKFNSATNFLYFDIQSFEVISISGPTSINLTQSKTDNDKTMRFLIEGIDLEAKVDGKVGYLWKRSITIDSLKVRNVTI